MSLSQSPAPEKTRSDLEWDRVLAAVAERCAGPLGRDLARALPFASSPDEARAWLSEAEEAKRLLDVGEPLPVTDTPDVREAIDRVRVGGVLGPAELRAAAQMLAAARSLRRHLAARRAVAPRLEAACGIDPSLDAVADEIAGAFEPDGTLSDHASPKLRELRAEYRAARGRMLSRLDELMHRYEGILQDRFVTEREGRWVVPVRSDAHERFPGIVHATSGSGATLFVEPRAVVPLGNRLKVLESDVTREEIAVYARLSGLLGDVLPSAQAAARAIARADVRAAVAKLAHELSLTFPTLVEEPRIELRAARHPLLALDLPKVVPSDLSIAAGHAVVVSGPNAGGKTVALKTIGLAALMVLAGIPVACADGSVVGIFEVVLTDVGDDQSLQKNLSTFSAHVRNLASILDETRRGALVLLDELCGGTDPREGEALAAGVLDSLCARHGAVMATTHYEGLKALALADDRFQNASAGFDLATMTPTFRLALGVPGRSSALAVARTYGMPQTVVERAERFLSKGDHDFESLVRTMNDERAALDLARRAAEDREREAREARARLEAEIGLARDREKQMLSREAQDLVSKLRRAKEDLAAAQARLRTRKVDEAGRKEAEKAIERVAAEVAIGGALEPLTVRATETAHAMLAPGQLRKGLRVYVPRLRAEAEVIELLGDGSVRVAAGPLKMAVATSDLRAAGAAAEPRRAPATREAPRRADAAPIDLEVPIQTSDNSCDLRGLRADDAVSMATTFLDRSLSSGRRIAFLIHGHGTGALREALRTELQTSGYVARFRPGEMSEGGDGVTVVWLR